jgi:hypothetical protein
MRFLIDENLSRRLIRWFAAKQHVAEHVEDVLGQSTDDRAIVAYARSHSAIIVSKDYDFVEFPGWGSGRSCCGSGLATSGPAIWLNAWNRSGSGWSLPWWPDKLSLNSADTPSGNARP